MIDYPALRLKKNEERRIRAGHPWIFSNEVDNQASPLGGFSPGQPVTVVDHHGKALGNAYLNPHSLICARLLTRDPNRAIDQSLLTHRFNLARSLREGLYDQPYHRAVFGESDGLPGLVIDRYGSLLVAQINTAGMEAMKSDIIDAARKAFGAQALLWRNDAPVRSLEGLDPYIEPAFGEIPEQVTVEEGGLVFHADPVGGQKTGWFYDQRANRDRVTRHPVTGRVLDLFSYLGAWGLRLVAAGAEQVLCVDASARAVEGIESNARANGLEDRVEVLRADAFEALGELHGAGERFDWVIVDPPAFAKRRKDLGSARRAYQRLNRLALQVLRPDGRLVSCSCSYHLSATDLGDALNGAARHVDRQLQFLEPLAQGPDHPVHPALAESAYLKGWLARVLPTG